MTDAITFALRASRVMPPHTTTRFLTALLLLDRETQPIRSRALAEMLGIPKPSLTRLTDHMSIIGYATKHRQGKDRRHCWVQITDKGRDCVRKLLTPSLERAA